MEFCRLERRKSGYTERQERKAKEEEQLKNLTGVERCAKGCVSSLRSRLPPGDVIWNTSTKAWSYCIVYKEGRANGRWDMIQNESGHELLQEQVNE
jgi:hypothetical protein